MSNSRQNSNNLIYAVLSSGKISEEKNKANPRRTSEVSPNQENSLEKSMARTEDNIKAINKAQMDADLHILRETAKEDKVNPSGVSIEKTRTRGKTI